MKQSDFLACVRAHFAGDHQTFRRVVQCVAANAKAGSFKDELAKQALGIVDEGARGGVPPRTVARLATIANAFWFPVLFLAVIGLVTLRSAPRAAQVLVLSVPLAWLAVHVLFHGGPRFHAPETPFLALLAARGAEEIVVRLRAARRPQTAPAPVASRPS